MRLQYLSVPPSQMNALRSDPDLAPSLLMDEPADALAGLGAAGGGGLQAQLQAIQQKLRAVGIELPNLPGLPGLFGAPPGDRSAGGSPRLRLVQGNGEIEDGLGPDEELVDGQDGRASQPADHGGAGSPGGAGAGRVRGALEKAWHGLHFVFTGRADEAPSPMGYLLSGGEDVGEDMGYGPARLLSPKEVRAFRDGLAAIHDEEFDRRFDLAALRRSDVYPNCWDEERDELLEEYRMYFEQLRGALDQIASDGDGLLIGLT